MSDSKGFSIGIGGVVQIVFLILKLAKLITWKWWVVLLPLELNVALLLIMAILYILSAILEERL